MNEEGKEKAAKKKLSLNVQLGKIPALEIMNFTKHLAVMVKSGITIHESLDTLASKTKAGQFHNILDSISADLNSGFSFTSAIEKFPKVFDAFYINIIRIGEETGSLESNLEYMAQKLEKQAALRRKIKEALFYPTIVVTAAVIVGLGISVFILPKMSDLFRSFDMELPWATRVLLSFADFMKKYNYIVAAAIIAAFVGFRLLLLTKFKRYWQMFLMKLPVLGPFFIAAETASLCRNLGIMLRSGMPINRTLEIASKTTDNPVFRGYVEQMRKAVSEGISIGDFFYSGKCSRIPAMATKMISVGEKSGKMNDMLLYLGDYYEEETDSLAKSFATVLEPILLLFIGGIVVIVALAIISPIYQLTGAIKK